MIFSFFSNIFGLMLVFWIFDDIYVSPTIVSGIDRLKIIILAGIMLSIINTFIKPVLKIVAFPVALLTLGTFYFVLNAFILGFVAWIIPEIHIESLTSLFIASFILSVINNISHKISKH